MFCNVLIPGLKSYTQPALADTLKEILDALNNLSFVDRVVPQGDLKLCIDNVKLKILDSVKYYNSLNCHRVVDEVVDSCGGEKISGYLIFSRYLDLANNQIRLYDFPFKPIVVDEIANERIADLKRLGNESEAKRRLILSSVMEPQNEGRRIRFRLNHHSVILDRQKRYIECLYEKFPIARENAEVNYLFIPHSLGKSGYSLDAYFQL